MSSIPHNPPVLPLQARRLNQHPSYEAASHKFCSAERGAAELRLCCVLCELLNCLGRPLTVVPDRLSAPRYLLLFRLRTFFLRFPPLLRASASSLENTSTFEQKQRKRVTKSWRMLHAPPAHRATFSEAEQVTRSLAKSAYQLQHEHAQQQ